MPWDKLSMDQLADVVGVTQSRVARIEGGVGTKNMSFDLLFRVLLALGYEYKISMRKVSDTERILTPGVDTKKLL